MCHVGEISALIIRLDSQLWVGHLNIHNRVLLNILLVNNKTHLEMHNT